MTTLFVSTDRKRGSLPFPPKFPGQVILTDLQLEAKLWVQEGFPRHAGSPWTFGTTSMVGIKDGRKVCGEQSMSGLWLFLQQIFESNNNWAGNLLLSVLYHVDSVTCGLGGPSFCLEPWSPWIQPWNTQEVLIIGRFLAGSYSHINGYWCGASHPNPIDRFSLFVCKMGDVFLQVRLWLNIERGQMIFLLPVQKQLTNGNFGKHQGEWDLTGNVLPTLGFSCQSCWTSLTYQTALTSLNYLRFPCRHIGTNYSCRCAVGKAVGEGIDLSLSPCWPVITDGKMGTGKSTSDTWIESEQLPKPSPALGTGRWLVHTRCTQLQEQVSAARVVPSRDGGIYQTE